MNLSSRGPGGVAALTLGAVLLVGAAVWIGFAENKSWAMVLAMVALILARTLYVGTPTGTPEENPEESD